MNTRTLRIAGCAILLLLATTAAADAQVWVKNNRLGVGTDNPINPLHVVSTTAGGKVLARYTNNGAPYVQYEDTSLGIAWGLQPLANGDFSITLNGSGGGEFVVKTSGQVIMGPGGVLNFNLDTFGNLVIAGSLTQGSSRELKEGLEGLDSRAVLARVANLDVLEWSYTNQAARHIGPMAEDFHAAFGLGADAKGVAPSDVAGVALVALQGLHGVVQEKDDEIQRLSRELAELRALVEELASQ